MTHIHKPHHSAVPIACQVNDIPLWNETIKTCDMRSYATAGLQKVLVLQA